nr:general transcription factor 3C polypeptide 3-like isoform X1 [Ipomoea batatas]
MGEETNEVGSSEDGGKFVSNAGSEKDVELDGSEGASGSDDECDDGYSGESEEEEVSEEEVTPFSFLEDDANYEALAEKKRKAVAAHQNEGPSKKQKETEVLGASFDEIMEAMCYGSKRKSRRRKRKKGRPKGSRGNGDPVAKKLLGEATLCYATGDYERAVKLLTECIRRNPTHDAYHTLGLVYNAKGDKKRAIYAYMLATKSVTRPKETSLWKSLLSWFLDQGNSAAVNYYLPKAIAADPEDITLKFLGASHYTELQEHEKAAKLYEQIHQLCPDNSDACISAAELYKQCGKVECSLVSLENYLSHYPTGGDPRIMSMLISICIENGEYSRALQHIRKDCSGKELSFDLTAKAGICYLHLGDLDNAKALFGAFHLDNANDFTESIIEIADTFKKLEHYESALHYYLMLERKLGPISGTLNLKIAECYLSLRKMDEAITFFRKAIPLLENSVETRLTLASLLLEKEKDKEAISFLSPPNSEFGLQTVCNIPEKWWHEEKVQLRLANIYRDKDMTQEFVDTFYPLVYWSLTSEGPKKRKASRAKRVLQRRSELKEEKKTKILAAGLDWKSEDSDDEFRVSLHKKKPPTPKLLKDEENHQLFVDLTKALASLGRYEEAFDVCNLTLRFASDILSNERRDSITTLGAQLACKIQDAKGGCSFLRHFLHQHPSKMAAWTYYYKALSKLEIAPSTNNRFLLHARSQQKDCIPPIIIAGHQFCEIGQYQVAAREYLEAHKLLPNCPLINLCIGTALINLAFDIRLKNKHQCVLQGLAFLYSNLQLCENSQEALYNIARAYQQVGLVSLAASYYENVLTTMEKDCPIPSFPYENQCAQIRKPGHCDLRREAAYNLHLIYKASGAFDLARQVLQDHCTV